MVITTTQPELSNQLLQLSDTPMFITDAAGLVQEINSAFKRLMGFIGDEVIGQSFTCFLQPAERGAALMWLLGLATGSRRQRGTVHLQPRGGGNLTVVIESVWVGKGNDNHQILHKLQTQALDHQRDLLRRAQVFEHLPIALFVLDGNLGIIDANLSARSLLGLKGAVPRGRPVASFLQDKLPQSLLDYLPLGALQALQLGTSIQQEEGHQIWINRLPGLGVQQALLMQWQTEH